jgi:hypothetical protein
MHVRCVLWPCNTVDMRVRYGEYLCSRVVCMWINVSGATIGYLPTQMPPLVGRKEAEPAYGAHIMHVRCVLWPCNTVDVRVRYGAYPCTMVLCMWINVSGATIGYLSTNTPPLVGRKEAFTCLRCSHYARTVRAVALQYCRYAGKMWCISLPQGTVYVDKCIRSNDRVLAYTNAASSRQEGSLTGLLCSHYARTVRAVALKYCRYAGKIWCISLLQGTVYVDKCIRSNDRVLVYTNAASSRQEGSLTGLRCSHYARTARAVAL